jgi:hypothetical protein
MEADAMDFSLLFTGIADYYARLGFAPIARTRLKGILRQSDAATSRGVAVRAASPDDLARIFEIYEEYNRDRPIAVQRSPAYWRDWVGLTAERLRRADPPLVAEDAGGRVVGYVVYQDNFYQADDVPKEYAYISEIGVDQADGGANGGDAARTRRDVVVALVQAVAQRALAAGKRELRVDVALDADVRAAAAEVCERVAENVTEGAMGRLLHKDNLLRSLLLEWNERWIAAGRPRGDVDLETPYGPTRLDTSGQFLRVEAGSGGAGALPQSTLLGLVFGFTRPEQTAVTAVQTPLLAALFPPQDAVYWSDDGF